MPLDECRSSDLEQPEKRKKKNKPESERGQLLRKTELQKPPVIRFTFTKAKGMCLVKDG